MATKITPAELKQTLTELLNEEVDTYDASAKEIVSGHVIALSRAPVKSIRKLEDAGEQYVYDIGMRNENEPWFFGNDILVHNSCYFTAIPMLKQNPALMENWNKETAVQIYDELAEQTNQSFPEMMERSFHCPRKNGEIIKAGREIVADRGLFIKKKKYAVNIYDKEGKRKDKDGKRGDIKAMGLDLKRSDTPKYVQVFLAEILDNVLNGDDKEVIIGKIREFKKKLREMDAWTKGSPKGVKRLNDYATQLEKANSGKGNGKVNMPGHVRASINWNYLKKMNGDNYSQSIVDGMKIVVCKLRDNPLGITSIAYPVDQLRLPQWFIELPFDELEMERVLLDEKVENMLSVLNWDLRENTDVNSTFDDLFSFE
jgi:hypothetical protein